MMKTINTNRLILREWEETDVEDLFEYAKTDLVGPNAGWLPHKDRAESLQIIKDFKASEQVYAIVLKAENKVIGGIGFHYRTPDPKRESLDQREIGYVLNPKYWGNAYVPEAVNALIDYGFNELDLDLIWCAHYSENARSKRVIEKCGFAYQMTQEQHIELLNEDKSVLYYIIENRLK